MPAAAAGAILLMWLVSLFLPVWRAREDMAGYNILLAGCLGMQPAWLGNPLIIAVCLLVVFGVTNALVMIPLALALVLVFVAAAATKQILVDEGGGKAVIERKFAGFYLWMAAVMGSTLLALYLAVQSLA